MDKRYYIYAHINKTNKKIYIGQTCQKPSVRWANGIGYRHQPYFWNAIQKYGWDGFEHIILFENLSLDEANIIEECLIRKYNSTNAKYGYNNKFGGKNSNHSEETKNKIRENASTYWLNKPKSDEVKEKIRQTQTGKKYSEATNKLKGKSGKENYFYGKLLGDSINARPVNQYDKNNVFISAFSCAKEASMLTNIDSSCITKCCKGKRKTAGGFIWEYA